MTAIANGIAPRRPDSYTATFLVFSDYARNAIRMAALMKQRQIMVYTHDSIGLGEDGPTTSRSSTSRRCASSRICRVWRPADATETAIAWTAAVRACRRPEHPGPVAPEPADRDAKRVADADIARAATSCPTMPTPTRADRHRLRGQTGARRSGCAGRRRHRRARRVDAVHQRLSTARTRPTAPCSVPMPRVAIEPPIPTSGASTSACKGAVIGIDRFGESAPAGQLFDLSVSRRQRRFATTKALLS